MSAPRFAEVIKTDSANRGKTFPVTRITREGRVIVQTPDGFRTYTLVTECLLRIR